MKHLKEATPVTKLTEDQSKHDLMVHGGIKLHFKMEPCCDGVVLLYLRKRDVPEGVENVVMSMIGADSEQLRWSRVASWSVHKRWWDFALGGFEKRVVRKLAKLKADILKHDKARMDTDRLRDMLEA